MNQKTQKDKKDIETAQEAVGAAIERDFSYGLVEVAEAAAIAASRVVGLGDSKGADRAAVDAMRAALNRMPIKGTVVIGEGERDKAPMLYIGEEVGAGGDIALDIALDPLEGTGLAAAGAPESLAVIAIAPRHSMLHAPDIYMDKLVIGPGYKADIVSLEMSPSERVRALAKAKGCATKDIRVCVLDRPRHEAMVADIRTTGAAVILIPDGDIAAAIHVAHPRPSASAIDIYMGSGGAPEGVLAAAALSATDSQFYGRLLFANDDEYARAKKAGISDFTKIYRGSDLAQKGALFAATGVTNGSLLAGVSTNKNTLHTQTLLISTYSQSARTIKTRRQIPPAA